MVSGKFPYTARDIAVSPALKASFHHQQRQLPCVAQPLLQFRTVSVFRRILMRSAYRWLLVIAILSLCANSTLAGQDRYVRIRYLEGEVSLYPSDRQRSSEATVNTPVLDGDEIQTGNGRAELAFRNGITIRIGDYSGVRIQSAYSPMTLHLLQGTVFVDSHLIDRFQDELEVQAGDARVYLINEGNMRVDLGTEGTVRVTSEQGQAEVMANGRRVLLKDGERTYVDRGRAPEQPEPFYGNSDDLDQWNQSRMDSYNRDFGDYGSANYVDEDIYYDANDLDEYGDWQSYGEYGNVWVPQVDYGWRPYYDGRWDYGNSDWFWVSYEPWGWAPYHYGRWGWGFDIGWYWIPGNVFAPAWVSWYSYGDYIGWCPLNYYNYPNYYYNNHYYDRNYSPIQKQKTLTASDSWTFVRKNDLGATHIKKAVLAQSEVKNIRIEKEKLIISPRKELVSYVMPKTTEVPAYVNDKRIQKQPEDIRNPLGIKHREEQFERGSITRGQANSIKTPSEHSKKPAETQPHNSYPKPDNDYQRPDTGPKPTPDFNRDSQFKRKNESNKHYSPYVNPYYRDRDNHSYESDKSYERNEKDSRLSPHFMDRDDYDRYRKEVDRDGNPDPENHREVSPRYMEEARKYFERFQQKNQSDTERSEPRNYQPQRPEYKAPEVRRPEYKQPEYKHQSRPGNSPSRSQPNSSRSQPKQKPPNNKHN